MGLWQQAVAFWHWETCWYSITISLPRRFTTFTWVCVASYYIVDAIVMLRAAVQPVLAISAVVLLAQVQSYLDLICVHSRCFRRLNDTKSSKKATMVHQTSPLKVKLFDGVLWLCSQDVTSHHDFLFLTESSATGSRSTMELSIRLVAGTKLLFCEHTNVVRHPRQRSEPKCQEQKLWSTSRKHHTRPANASCHFQTADLNLICFETVSITLILTLCWGCRVSGVVSSSVADSASWTNRVWQKQVQTKIQEVRLGEELNCETFGSWRIHVL